MSNASLLKTHGRSTTSEVDDGQGRAQESAEERPCRGGERAGRRQELSSNLEKLLMAGRIAEVEPGICPTRGSPMPEVAQGTKTWSAS